MLTLWWVGVTVVGCGAMVTHTRDAVGRSCAQAVADAIALAHAGHGDAGAARLATRVGARIAEIVTSDHGTIHVTVESPCGAATSAATLG